MHARKDAVPHTLPTSYTMPRSSDVLPLDMSWLVAATAAVHVHLVDMGCLLQHLLTTDAISWSVLSCIRLTEEDTTSSSRIFIKILFQDLSENLGLMSLNQRLQEPTLQMFFGGIFPKVGPSPSPCHSHPLTTRDSSPWRQLGSSL